MMNNIKADCERSIQELDADEALENAKRNVKTACDKLAPISPDALGFELLKILDCLDRARRILGQKITQ